MDLRNEPGDAFCRVRQDRGALDLSFREADRGIPQGDNRLVAPTAGSLINVRKIDRFWLAAVK
jgi:hypothetical protein